MTPDIDFVQERFDRFNAEIFGGELPRVPLSISRAKSYLGNLEFRIRVNPDGTRSKHDFKLRISALYDRPEREVEDTIIHEMIHLYINYFNITDTAPHGVTFRGMMRTINERHNREIRISHRGSKTHPTSSRNTSFHVVAVLRFNDGRYGFKVLPRVVRTILNYYYRCISVRGIESLDLYVSNNPFFHSYPNSGSLKFHQTERDIIEEALEGAEIIEISDRTILRGQGIFRRRSDA